MLRTKAAKGTSSLSLTVIYSLLPRHAKLLCATATPMFQRQAVLSAACRVESAARSASEISYVFAQYCAVMFKRVSRSVII